VHNYERKLNVSIADNAGKKLYDVTVQNTSRRQSTPAVMPLLVQSAFKRLPGRERQGEAGGTGAAVTTGRQAEPKIGACPWF
jgi:hypothetical protein